METSFYNTISSTGKQLKLYNKNAKSQESNIAEFMKNYKDKWFSSWDLKRLVFNGKIKDGSLSRSLRNLTKAGILLKSEKPIKIGECKIKVHGWRFK